MPRPTNAPTMERGAIALDSLAGGLDLYTTLESGQSYLWHREDGRTYEGHGPDAWGDDPPWYATVVDGEVLRVRQTDTHLEWEGTDDLDPVVRRLLGLDDDLDAIMAAAPDDPTLERAYEYARGLRIVRDPAVPCLVSFICSAQMRVGRIHTMVRNVTREYGTAHEFQGRTYHEFPDADALAAATEAELRDLGLGYRAPYVQRTAEMVAEGEGHPKEARAMDYEDAREYLTQFVGVGQKVADCVCLFSLEHLEAVPLDTWIRTAIEEHYPDCDRGSYGETSAAIREQFGVPPGRTGYDGGEYAGYVQTYVFHWLRTTDGEV